MAGSLQELWTVIQSLLSPWQFLLISLSFLPGTLYDLVKSRDFTTLRSWSLINDAWFNDFWHWVGPEIRKGRGGHVRALLEGRMTQGRAVDVPVAPRLSGVVLDIGPGVGFWVDLLAEFAGQGEGEKTQIYGVEPNLAAHRELRSHVLKAGLQDTYEIIPLGIEALRGGAGKAHSRGEVPTFEKESVDCIVTVLCLCSIPEPKDNIEELYKLLKKGGRWYVYEHVKVKRSWGMSIYQRVINLVWPSIIGGCQMCRDTEAHLRGAGPWAKIDLAQPPDELWHSTLPHVAGVLTK